MGLEKLDRTRQICFNTKKKTRGILLYPHMGLVESNLIQAQYSWTMHASMIHFIGVGRCGRKLSNVNLLKVWYCCQLYFFQGFWDLIDLIIQWGLAQRGRFLFQKPLFMHSGSFSEGDIYFPNAYTLEAWRYKEDNEKVWHWLIVLKCVIIYIKWSMCLIAAVSSASMPNESDHIQDTRTSQALT